MTEATTINLTKGEIVNLDKQAAGGTLAKAILGLGWDMAQEGTSVDLDASVILYDANNAKLGHVFFNEKTAQGVSHAGDNLTGAGDGDDEQIDIDFSALAPEVTKILATITSYQDHTLDKVANAFARVVNSADNTELIKYNMTGMDAKTGLYVGLFTKGADGWSFKAIGETANGKTFADLVPGATPYLS